MGDVFSGRVLFDHIEKTAGQALNAWLRNGLGKSAVTPPIGGIHRDLIKLWGGEYSVIFGHVLFDGTGLDPRYQYVTLLRDPVERALSHLFFILNNHEPDSLPEWRSYQRFLLSEGDVVELPVLQRLVNYHVDHFAQAESRLHRPAIARLADAQAVLDRYAVWGFYESMPEFLGELSAFLGLPAPASLTPVNVTLKKPRTDQVSPKLRARLTDLNALDLTFHRVARERYSKRQGRPVARDPSASRGNPAYDTGVSLISASPVTLPGDEIAFRLEIELARPVSEMVAGIQIRSEDGWLAFGTNSELLERPLRNLPAGRHRLEFRLGANLPEGRYRAGFGFQEPAADGMRTLAWVDEMVTFQTRIDRRVPSIGACALTASLDHGLAGTATPARGWVERLRGSMHLRPRARMR